MYPQGCLPVQKAVASVLGFGFIRPTAVGNRVIVLLFLSNGSDIALDYMNGFRCNVTGSTSNVALATPQLPRRCGIDTTNKVTNPTPGNCTYGAKHPFYWFQAEQNNASCNNPYNPNTLNSL